MSRLEVGFTGTRQGMRNAQRRKVRDLLRWWDVICGHNGDCLGADEEFSGLCAELEIPVILHPCNIPAARAHFADPVVLYVHDELPPLLRNHRIVDDSDVLIAAPAGFTEELRSGTWATLRYARTVGLPYWVVYPDGMYEQSPGRYA